MASGKLYGTESYEMEINESIEYKGWRIERTDDEYDYSPSGVDVLKQMFEITCPPGYAIDPCQPAFGKGIHHIVEMGTENGGVEMMKEIVNDFIERGEIYPCSKNCHWTKLTN